MERLKKLRKERGLNQSALAKQLDISVSAYGNYELDQRDPSIETLIKLADFYNVSIDYLLGRDNSIYTADDYANGVRDTKKISGNADQEEVFDKTNEVIEVFGNDGKELIIGFCDILLKKIKN